MEVPSVTIVESWTRSLGRLSSEVSQITASDATQLQNIHQFLAISLIDQPVDPNLCQGRLDSAHVTG
jgi:hypothetical protein